MDFAGVPLSYIPVTFLPLYVCLCFYKCSEWTYLTKCKPWLFGDGKIWGNTFFMCVK